MSYDAERRSSETELVAVGKRLRTAGNAALRAGAFWAGLLGLSSAAVLPVVMAFGAAQGLEGPWLFSCCATFFCVALWLLARRDMVHGAAAWAVFIPFVSLPTGFFVLSHFMLPAGAATFITGPISYLYLVLIVITGFLFEFRLPAVAGLVAAGGYMLAWFLAKDRLACFDTGDALLGQDLSSGAIFAVKAMMMLFCGLIVGALAAVARRLVIDVHSEESEKLKVSRLFGQYVSEEVRNRILSQPGMKRGERKEVVVLFSDIRNFSTYSENRPPEEIVGHLNEYLDAMVGCIRAKGGVIDKFVGDAIMAVFGGVLDLPDPAGAAVGAALDMRSALVRLNLRWTTAGEPLFENGIGIHMGEVLQGPIGSEDRREFTVIGDVVNTASRVESLTKTAGSKIIVTDAVFNRLPDALKQRCAALGKVVVKGRAAEVELFGVSET